MDRLPETLDLPGAAGLRLLAHEARQRVIAEIYDGRELTATEAAEICGLTPSAMSYHLRTLEKAGVLVRVPDGADGRERRYRQAAGSLRVRGPGGSRADMQATAMLWVESLSRAASRWLDTGAQGHGGMLTEVLRLTDEQNAELVRSVQELYGRYAALSEANGPEVPQWESYWAHMARPDAAREHRKD